jgi:hypothetical protein
MDFENLTLDIVSSGKNNSTDNSGLLRSKLIQTFLSKSRYSKLCLKVTPEPGLLYFIFVKHNKLMGSLCLWINWENGQSRRFEE